MDKMTVTVLRPMPFEYILPTAKKHFRDAGYIVMFKDMYTSSDCVNRYDHHISTNQYKEIK